MTTERLKEAMRGQYRAGIAMVRGAIELCPDELWTAGNHPRQFWRLAYHVLYFTHLYLEIRAEDFQRWEKDTRDIESEEMYLEVLEPFTREELLEYCAMVDAMVEPKLAAIDLDAPESGFWWYKIPKLDHQLVNIRHVQEHAGQLRDRLLEHGLDPAWVSRIL